MKKILAIVLALVMVFSFAACGKKDNGGKEVDYSAKSEGVMTYAEYAAAAVDDEVTVEVFVQDHQSWWDGKMTVYAADPDGAYFFYELKVDEADAEKFTPGTKIIVTGYTAEYAGEQEVAQGTFEFCEEGSGYIAEAVDATAWFGTEELEKHMNEYISVKAKFVSLSYKQSDYDKDIYVKVEVNGAEYDLCVENYLTGPDTEVYKTVEGLQAGDEVTLTGFNYWYNGPNMHITGCTK